MKNVLRAFALTVVAFAVSTAWIVGWSLTIGPNQAPLAEDCLRLQEEERIHEEALLGGDYVISTSGPIEEEMLFEGDGLDGMYHNLANLEWEMSHVHIVHRARFWPTGMDFLGFPAPYESDPGMWDEDQTTDVDSDGFPDEYDNCLKDWNPDQFDRDQDGEGLVCDKEDDVNTFRDVVISGIRETQVLLTQVRRNRQPCSQ